MIGVLPHVKGTYLLLVLLPCPMRLQVGRLGTFDLSAGHYAYAGSALGPGGLAARVARHLNPSRRQHWHIDRLLNIGKPQAVWYVELPVRLECAWARAVAALPGASLPVPRFGASDCRCPAHLIGLPSPLDEAMLRAVLVGTLPTPFPISRWALVSNPTDDIISAVERI